MSATERALRETNEYVRRKGLEILQRWNNPNDRYSVWDAVQDCARLYPHLVEPSAPSLVPKDTQGDEAQVSNEGKAP